MWNQIALETYDAWELKTKFLHYLLSLDKGWFPTSMEYLLNCKQFSPIKCEVFWCFVPHMMVSQASSVDGRLEGGKHWHAHLFLLGWTLSFILMFVLYYCNNIFVVIDGRWQRMYLYLVKKGWKENCHTTKDIAKQFS